MILRSNREMDVAFVSKAIREQKLNPTPVAGFHSKPLYWQETARWRRVVEEYSWGCVLFLDDREIGLHSTVVVVGKFNPDTGKAKGKGQKTPVLAVKWYSDLAKGLKSVKVRDEVQIPQCLGFHETDHICDGGIHPQTKAAEPPCSWRDNCMALQSDALSRDQPVEQLLRSKSHDQIIQLTTNLRERTQSQAVSKRNSSATAKPGDKPAQPVGEGQAPVQIVEDAVREVADACEVGVALDQVSAADGDMFIVDRTSHTDYISVYQSLGVKVRPKGVCSFRLRKRISGFRVQLPVPKDSPMLNGIVDNDVAEWNDGAWKSAVNHVIPGENRMNHIKVIMAKIVQGKTE